MPRTLYRYNAETCQYERVRVKTFDVIFYLSGLAVTSLLILAGILVAHDYIIDSEKETQLRNENAALRRNHVILTSQLYDIETTLDSLAEEDRELHHKFFNSPIEAPLRHAPTADKKTLFLGGSSSFRETANKVAALTNELLTNSTRSNRQIAKLSIGEKMKSRNLSALPWASPVIPFHGEQIVSGFGMRVNPFHKGMYEHYGLDFALPRGTPIKCTADGIVIESKRNTVQAGYGNYVDLKHDNGYVTRYAHLDDVVVKMGQRLTKGSIVGLSGNTGGSVAPHLHYEVILNGSPVDPVQYIIEGLSSGDHQFIAARAAKQNQSLD